MARRQQSEAPLDRIQIRLRGIGEALKNCRLTVPPYQRDYAWEERQVDELLQDLQQAIRAHEPDYFLGSIVVSNGNDAYYQVTDGQQRLATITIILAAIRDYFIETGDQERADSIAIQFLLSKDLRTLDVIPRLRLNDHDHLFYERRILRRQNVSETSPLAEAGSHQRLDGAARKVKEYFEDIVKTNANNPSEVLLDWVEFIENRAKVIWVTVPDDTNAFTIFETLNDRGLDLAISDLLKNFLFHKAGSHLDAAQSHWIEMTSVLEATSEEDILVTFLRHYWSSWHGLTRERDLYKQVKHRVTSPRHAVELSESLAGEAKLYAALANTGHELWREYGATAQGHIGALNVLRMKQMRPLLLAILNGFSRSEAKKAFRFLVSCAVRLLIVGGRGGTVEETYSNVAKRIRERAISTAASMRQALEGIFPADAQFRDAFAVATVSKDYLARYYLRALERAANHTPNPEFVPNPNEDEVNLEHVLPEHPDQNWPGLTADECKALYKRIGNLALLKATDNSTIGNQSFAIKVPVLKKSTFLLTKQIAKKKRWDAVAIDERQRDLAKLALSTWSKKLG